MSSLGHAAPAERGADAWGWHEIPREEGRRFFTGTIKAFLTQIGKHIIKRIADFIAPGAGVLLDAVERAMSVVRVLKSVGEGAGTLDVPVFKAGGIDFMLDIRVGGDGTNSELPVSAYLAPGDGALFGGFEVTPLKQHHRLPRTTEGVTPVILGKVTQLTEDGDTRVALAEADLSALIDLPEPSAAAAMLREWATQQLTPRLEGSLGKSSLEFVIVFDPEFGAGAWVRLQAGKSAWRVILRTDPQTQALVIDVVRVAPAAA